MQERRVALALAAIATGCGGEGTGTLDIRIYGEEFIEDEMPTDDGWTVTFDSFLVSVGEVAAATGRHADAALDDPTYRVFDLSEPSGGEGHPVTVGDVETGTYDATAYRIASPPSDAEPGNATAADVERMIEGGWAILVSGAATSGADALSFTWGFGNATHYVDCESGAAVSRGGSASIEITIHGDHLFYDDLIHEEANVAFDLVAEADANDDGDVTEAELEAFDIETQERYQVGSFDIDDLWGFIEHLATTVGHIDGEGHCHTTDSE